jgi:hypothetical protein
MPSPGAEAHRHPDQGKDKSRIVRSLGLHRSAILSLKVATLKGGRSLPRLLDELGVRIGLTFRADITNQRAARVLHGGIMAFGNRLLPCTLREGASRPDPMARRGAAEPRPRSIRKTLVNRRGPNGYPKELAAAGLEPATPGL